MASDDTHKIAGRYARALFALAAQAKVLEAVESDLRSLKNALAQSAELSRLLTGPLLPRHGKAGVVDAVLVRLKAQDLSRKFVAQLANAGRMAALESIIDEFAFLMTTHRGEIVLEVTTAAPTDTDALAAALAKAYGRKVQVHTSVDPTLIGGMIVRQGGIMMDYSLKNRLSKLSRTLKVQAA